MGNGKTLGAEVTPAFYETVEDIHDRRDDGSMSETARHLMREGAYQYDEPGLIRSFFKWTAVGLAVTALVVFAYGTAVGYPQPAVLGAWIMVPSLVSLALYDEWPAISKRFSSDTSTAKTGA